MDHTDQATLLALLKCRSLGHLHGKNPQVGEKKCAFRVQIMRSNHPLSGLEAVDIARIDRHRRGILKYAIDRDVELLLVSFAAVCM